MQQLPLVSFVLSLSTQWKVVFAAVSVTILGSLSGCASAPEQAPTETRPVDSPLATTRPSMPTELPAVLWQAKSRWVAVPWSDLPAFEQDNLQDAWPAWLRSCERPSKVWAPVCPAVRELANASPQDQRDWLRQRLQLYRVESLQSDAKGLLTSYYEPVLDASRQPQGRFQVPVYGPPAGLAQRKPWFTRQEIDTLPAAQSALRGKALVYLNDPVDAMVLHIQGSGMVRVREADGRQRTVRLAFAGTNEQAYQSIGRWLLDQKLTQDATWPGIKAWLDRNPSRTQELLWRNPRVVFFKEETPPPGPTPPGPKGAQGVPLTAGRSIAVDPGSIPYGTPVWLSSRGPQTALDRLVMAQDTGTAITGAVRADYYAGSGAEAGELAGRLKQSLLLWTLWPK